MVHTLPDYTTKYKLVKIFANIDSGELAARLGSIDYYDRRGNVLFMEDFESNLARWSLGLGGAGSDISLSTEHAADGQQSCKLLHSATAGESVGISTYLPMPEKGKLGFEFAFTRGANIRELDFTMQLYDGTLRHYVYIAYRFAYNKIQYTDSSFTIQDLVTDWNVQANDYLFHRTKIVVDTENKEYCYVMVDRDVYSMEDIGYYSSSDTTRPYLYVNITSVNNTDAANYTYIDNVIFTQNEP